MTMTIRSFPQTVIRTMIVMELRPIVGIHLKGTYPQYMVHTRCTEGVGTSGWHWSLQHLLEKTGLGLSVSVQSQ